jgi:RNA polymerase sigma factor (sigma-70 family)
VVPPVRKRSGPPGKQEFFAELLGRHGDKAYHFAYRLTGNEQDARDLVQEAFLRAYERLEAYDPDKPFDAWVGTILHNIFVDGTRRLVHRETVSLDAAKEEGGGTLADVLAEESRTVLEQLEIDEADQKVQAALDRVEPEMRTALILCDMEGMSYEEVARVMGCPIGTVRSRLARGRAKVRGLMGPYWEAGEVGHGAA